MRLSLRALLAAAAVGACYGPNAPPAVDPLAPPGPDYSRDAEAACSSACTNLRRIGCPEGSGAITGETCERRCVIGLELRSLPLACWAEADNVVSARSCGSLRCLR